MRDGRDAGWTRCGRCPAEGARISAGQGTLSCCISAGEPSASMRERALLAGCAPPLGPLPCDRGGARRRPSACDRRAQAAALQRHRLTTRPLSRPVTACHGLSRPVTACGCSAAARPQGRVHACPHQAQPPARRGGGSLPH